MKKEKRKVPEYIRKQRGDWGNINPVTKVIPNKKKDPKVKHKNRECDEYDSEGSNPPTGMASGI